MRRVFCFSLCFSVAQATGNASSKTQCIEGAKCDTALSLIQKTQWEGRVSMSEEDREATFLDADPQWFTNTGQTLQTEATNLTYFIDKCNAGTDPKEKLVEEFRTNHATCRSEQEAVNVSNVTQKCLDEKKTSCDTLQRSYEESFCNYAESKQNYCAEFESCHAAANNAWVTSKKKVEQHEKILKELFIEHKRLECKIAGWPSSKSACESQTFDTSHLDVTYPTKPTPLPCNHPVPLVPGDSDWTAAEYSTKSWKKFVEPVKSCTTPVPSPAPTQATPGSTYGYKVTYRGLHTPIEVEFSKGGVRTIPKMKSKTQDGCTITQPGDCENHGDITLPWDGVWDGRCCWSFTSHSILCDHPITADSVRIEFTSTNWKSAGGFTVDALNAGGSVLGAVYSSDSNDQLDTTVTLKIWEA